MKKNIKIFWNNNIVKIVKDSYFENNLRKIQRETNKYSKIIEYKAYNSIRLEVLYFR